MEVIQRTRQQVQPMEIIRHGHSGELQRLRLCSAGIDGIGRVGNQRAESVLRHQLPQSLHIGGIHLLGFSAPRVPGEELCRIAAQFQGFLSQGGKALGDGQMTADILHSNLLGYAFAFSASSFSSTV